MDFQDQLRQLQKSLEEIKSEAKLFIFHDEQDALKALRSCTMQVISSESIIARYPPDCGSFSEYVVAPDVVEKGKMIVAKGEMVAEIRAALAEQKINPPLD